MTARSALDRAARPATATSAGVVLGVSVVVVLAVGVVVGAVELAVVGLGAGGALAVASWLCNRPGPAAEASGSVVVAVGVLGVAYAVSRPLADGSVPVALGAGALALGALAAGLGAVATPPGSLGSGQWRRTVVRALATAVLPLAVVAWATVGAVRNGDRYVDSLVAVLENGANVVLFPVGPNANVGGFLALCGLAAAGIAVALGAVPIASFVEKDRRAAVADAAARTRWIAVRASVAAVLLGVAATAAPADALHGALTAVGVEPVLRAVVDAHALRFLLAAVGLLGVAVAAAARGVRRLARVDRRAVVRGAATTTPGGLALVGVAVVAPEAVLSRLRVGPLGPGVDAGVDVVGATPLAAGVLVAVVLGTATALSVLTTAAGSGFVPERTAAPTVAAGGVLLAGVAAGAWDGDHTLLTFGAVAAAMVVWDVGSYGVDLTAELDGATSRLVEVLHATGSAVVGVALVGAAFVALWAARTLAAGGALDGPGAVGLVLLTLATLGLMSTLRG